LDLFEGRFEEAGKNLEQCLDLCRSLGIRQVEAFALLDAGDLSRARDEWPLAQGRYEEALELFRELGIRDGLASAALAHGRLLREQGEEAEAKALFEEADALSTELGLADPGPLPAAYLALMGERDPTQVEVTEAAPAVVRAEAHLVLQMAGAGGIHSLKVRAILEEMSEHLQGAERDAFWKFNPVARMLAEQAGS
jgi:tetratricopeptide (TPR) repeat protein